MKQRRNFTLKEKTFIKLEQLSKHSVKFYNQKLSKSGIIDLLVERETRNPIQGWKEERDKAVHRVNMLSNLIKKFEGKGDKK